MAEDDVQREREDSFYNSNTSIDGCQSGVDEEEGEGLGPLSVPLIPYKVERKLSFLSAMTAKPLMKICVFV